MGGHKIRTANTIAFYRWQFYARRYRDEILRPIVYKIASNTLLSKLDAVDHSAIHFVTKSPYTTHHCDLYALVGWPTLHIRYQTHWLQVVYKSMLGKAPPYLSSLVTITTPTRSTRSSRYISLIIAKANTPFGRLSFQFSAASDWNKLQKSLKLETYTVVRTSI
jgi:hypothetical protein